jgi:mannose-6-phosphate isomerase-like protein (cupin superfamily)
MSGTVGVQIGFQEHVLSPRDSIAFDSTTPHRLFNVGDEPVHAIWFMVGRLGDEQDHGLGLARITPGRCA